MLEIKDDRLNEIVSFYLLNGEEKTLEAYEMSKPDTLRRYLNDYEKKTGNKKLKDISKILERYSNDELKVLAQSEKPSIAKKQIINFDGEEIKIGVLSDLHIGSKYTDENAIYSAIEQFKKDKVNLVLFPGDIVEGMSKRDGHIYELHNDCIGVKAQKKKAIEILSTCDIESYMIEGNHCLWSKQAVGYSPIEDIANAMPNCKYLGEHEGDIFINGIWIKLWHGIDGSSYALSYRLQQIINSLTGGEKPNVLIAGHDHKALYMFYRNIHSLAAGTLQKQSQWMRMKKLAAHTGFWELVIGIGDKEVKYFQSRFYPLYK